MGVKIDQDSEVGEYDAGMQRQLVLVLRRGELRPGHLKAVKPAS